MPAEVSCATESAALPARSQMERMPSLVQRNDAHRARWSPRRDHAPANRPAAPISVPGYFGDDRARGAAADKEEKLDHDRGRAKRGNEDYELRIITCRGPAKRSRLAVSTAYSGIARAFCVGAGSWGKLGLGQADEPGSAAGRQTQRETRASELSDYSWLTC